jgi:hypothetical protein
MPTHIILSTQRTHYTLPLSYIANQTLVGVALALDKDEPIRPTPTGVGVGVADCDIIIC